MSAIHCWKYAVAVLLAAGLSSLELDNPACFVRGEDLVPSARSAPANPLRPIQPVPIDMGKGIENKLDQLLEAIKALNEEALKITYFQGMLHGALAATLLLTVVIALKGANK
jgi:hypothetical protein